MTPWPGRNESPRRGGDELEYVLLVLPELRWLFGLRGLFPPSPQLLTFPAKDGVERALPREAVYLMTLYQQCLGESRSLPKITSSR